MSETTHSSARTLDNIREGGQAFHLIALARLREVERLMGDGLFQEALTKLDDGRYYVQSLAAAENSLSPLAGAAIVTAVDIEPGMTLRNVDGSPNVTAIEDTSIPCLFGPHAHPGRIIQFADGSTMTVPATDELLVERQT